MYTKDTRPHIVTNQPNVFALGSLTSSTERFLKRSPREVLQTYSHPHARSLSLRILYVYSSLAMLACPSILPSVCRSLCQAMDTHIKCETKMCPLQKGHAIIIYTRGRTMVVRGTWPKKKNYSVATRNPIQSKPRPTTGTGIFK